MKHIIEGNKIIAEYLVGKTAEYLRSTINDSWGTTSASGENLMYESMLYAGYYEEFRFHKDYDVIIKVLRKLKPALESLNDKTGELDKKEEINLILMSLDLWLTMYDITKLWEYVLKGIAILKT
jgi:hypothetical protein